MTMKNLKIRHGLYKNLPAGTVYNSQAGCVLFALCIAFKLSSAPGVVSETYGSSTLWAYLAMSAIEIGVTAAVFAFARMQGDDLLRCSGSRLYRLCCGAASIWLVLKGTFYFCYCVSYLAQELFGGVEPALLYLLFLAPIVYMGIKGSRSIARTCEIFIPVVAAFIIFNLVFYDTTLDFGRNLPVFALPPSRFFANLPRYGLWLGDALPFAFLRIKNKRLPYVSASIAISFGLVAIVIALGVATYGEALKMVTDLLIHTAGFNQLTTDIGRMEWSNLFCAVSLAILALSFIYFGAIAAGERATRTRAPMATLFPLAVIAVIAVVPSAQEAAEFAVRGMGYALTALAVILPFAMLFDAVATKRRLKGVYASLGAEYIPYPLPSPTRPHSLADNIMSDFKESSQESFPALDNGTLDVTEES